MSATKSLLGRWREPPPQLMALKSLRRNAEPENEVHMREWPAAVVGPSRTRDPTSFL